MSGSIQSVVIHAGTPFARMCACMSISPGIRYSPLPSTTVPAAGTPADPADLIDVDALLSAYTEGRPDPSDPAQRVAFGTSGHRGSAFRGAFNEAHILAVTQAMERGILGRDIFGSGFDPNEYRLLLFGALEELHNIDTAAVDTVQEDLEAEFRQVVETTPRSPQQLVETVNRLKANTKAYVRVWRAEPAFQLVDRR